MSERRRLPSRAAKRALLAGAALAVLWAPAALAQAPGKAERALAAPARPAAGPARDGLAEGELYMEADQVVRDDKARITTAEGNVEVRYQGRTLRADRLIYEEGAQEG